MEFGRVQKIDNIIFSLPADPVMTDRVLQSVGDGDAAVLRRDAALRGRDAALRVYVGGTGWGQAKWLGKVYPRGTKPKDFLGHYVREFNSIELNALWYNLQPKPVIERWAARAGPAFLQLPDSFGPSRAAALHAFSPELCVYAVEVFNRRFAAGLKAPQLIGEGPSGEELTLF